jgi:hypothetical protein
MIVIHDARLATPRRRCNSCSKVKSTLDGFYVRSWHDDEKTVARYVSPTCKVCHGDLVTARKTRIGPDATKKERGRTRRDRKLRRLRLVEDPHETPLIEELSDVGYSGCAQSGPITAHVAAAWSEEVAAPTEYVAGWWATDTSREEQLVGLALAA